MTVFKYAAVNTFSVVVFLPQVVCGCSEVNTERAAKKGPSMTFRPISVIMLKFSGRLKVALDRCLGRFQLLENEINRDLLC
jgi:hypothetical protein